MTEKTNVQPSLPVTDPDNVPVVFVSQVAGHGHLNGVINLTLATAKFTPRGEKIDPDMQVTSRLRMDLFCAQELRDALDGLIRQNTKPSTAKAN